jgi:hypothetical protein
MARAIGFYERGGNTAQLQAAHSRTHSDRGIDLDGLSSMQERKSIRRMFPKQTF